MSPVAARPPEETTGEAGDAATVVNSHAANVDPNAPMRLGHADEYVVQREIGRGGMGVVFRAIDENLNRSVAVKMLTLPPDSSGGRDRFLREARSAAKVVHPNIVAVHAVVESNPPLIVMEDVPGETLSQRLKRVGRLSADEVVAISRQIAAGLQAAHRKNLIHRDIKPSNILIAHDGHVKIVDFGLARNPDDSELSVEGDVCGTPRFMSPEQARGDRLDHRTDLFSLGSVMYMMCTGTAAFASDNSLESLHRIQADEPRPIGDFGVRVPPSLESLIADLMEKDPARRIQSAEDVHRRLEQLRQKSAPAAHASAKQKTVRPGRITALAVLAVFALLCTTEAMGLTQIAAFVRNTFRLETPQGTLLITVDDPDLSVRVNGRDIVVRDGNSGELNFRIGEYKVQASKDGQVVWQDIVRLTRDKKEILSIKIAPNASGQPTVPKQPTATYRPIVDEPVTLSGHDHFVLRVAYSPDETHLASIQFGGKLRVWKLATRTVLWEASVRQQASPPLLFSPDGSRVLCGRKQWRADSGEPLADLPAPILAFSHDKQRYLSMAASSRIEVHDVASDDLIKSIETNQPHIAAVAFSSDSSILATGGNSCAKVWNIETGRRVALVDVGAKPIRCLAFSPDGSTLVTGGRDRRVKVWDVGRLPQSDSKLLYSFRSHEDSITGIGFLRGGRYLVSVSSEAAYTFPALKRAVGQTIKFWDLKTGTEIHNQPGHRHIVTSLAIRRDGRQMVTGSYDKTIKVWSLVPPTE